MTAPKSPDPTLLPSRPDQVLTLAEWSFLNGFSERTGRRLRALGEGPIVTKISRKRRGVTVANNIKWQKSREMPKPAPPKVTAKSAKKRPTASAAKELSFE